MAVLFTIWTGFSWSTTHWGTRRRQAAQDAAERLRSCVRAERHRGAARGRRVRRDPLRVGKAGDAGLVAQKIIDVFKRPSIWKEGKLATASVGVTLYRPTATTPKRSS